MADPILKIEGLEVAVEDKPILKGVDLEVPQGEVERIKKLAKAGEELDADPGNGGI